MALDGKMPLAGRSHQRAIQMRDLRPDLVFVISGDVWRDFCIMREAWGHPLANGLVDECVVYIRRAIKAG